MIGHIIATAAVFEIHIETNIVTVIKPKLSLENEGKYLKKNYKENCKLEKKFLNNAILENIYSEVRSDPKLLANSIRMIIAGFLKPLIIEKLRK